MILKKANRVIFSEEDKYRWECILRSLKSNFVLDTKKNNYTALKSIEGVKTLPHVVAMFLCYYYDVPIELMCLHLEMSNQKYEEYKHRLISGLNKNERKLLIKIRLCKGWVEHNTKVKTSTLEDCNWLSPNIIHKNAS